ncbi:MAG: CooT family nickel-binding protein [Deltaproteobacteria bacterium]|nr:CooT family nickel-binding protein [Deltaproteobacteria bacterium]
MCESTAYVLKDGKEKLVLESVQLLEVNPGGVRIASIFGEEKIIQARVKTLSLVDHKILLEPIT